jgi:hypothetical protein
MEFYRPMCVTPLPDLLLGRYKSCSVFLSLLRQSVMAEKQISFRGLSPVNSRPTMPVAGETPTVFLLSPANLSGTRGKLLRSKSSQSDLVQRLRSSHATLAEVFSFVSGLYFRGKLAYATRFANPPHGFSGVRIITSSSGLLHPNYPVTLDWIRITADSSVHPDNPAYRDPLIRDGQILNNTLPPGTRVILLGSIATPKYIEPLLEIFGPRLYFPAEFVGRGDMSRGGLLLRCTREEMQLTYAPVTSTLRTTNGR